MSRLPCKNIDVMSGICSKSKKFCINCAGYEAREIESGIEGLREMTPLGGNTIVNDGLDDIIKFKKNNESFNSPIEKRFSSIGKEPLVIERNNKRRK